MLKKTILIQENQTKSSLKRELILILKTRENVLKIHLH